MSRSLTGSSVFVVFVCTGCGEPYVAAQGFQPRKLW